MVEFLLTILSFIGITALIVISAICFVFRKEIKDAYTMRMLDD